MFLVSQDPFFTGIFNCLPPVLPSSVPRSTSLNCKFAESRGESALPISASSLSLLRLPSSPEPTTVDFAWGRSPESSVKHFQSPLTKTLSLASAPSRNLAYTMFSVVVISQAEWPSSVISAPQSPLVSSLHLCLIRDLWKVAPSAI